MTREREKRSSFAVDESAPAPAAGWGRVRSAVPRICALRAARCSSARRSAAVASGSTDSVAGLRLAVLSAMPIRRPFMVLSHHAVPTSATEPSARSMTGRPSSMPSPKRSERMARTPRARRFLRVSKSVFAYSRAAATASWRAAAARSAGAGTLSMVGRTAFRRAETLRVRALACTAGASPGAAAAITDAAGAATGAAGSS